MAEKSHLKLIYEDSAKAWNKWREENPKIQD